MATRLTRAELYELVWDRPMTKLAKEFSLSDVALHKICRKHGIPTPPQGHWAKKAHGKPVKISPLPTDAANGPSTSVIVIHEGAANSETLAMSEARARVLAEIDAGASAMGSGPSAIIERTLVKLDKAKADRLGLARSDGGGLITAAIRPESIDRARLVLETLERTCRVAGIELGAANGRAAWLIDGESVAIELAEMPDRFEHIATEAELKAVEKWRTKRDADHKRYGYLSNYGEPHIPKWEDRYLGRLAIRLEEVRIRGENHYWGPVITRSFADTKTRDLLNMMPKIAATIAAIAVAKRENREVEEARRLAEQEAAVRRAEKERRAALEKRRVELLDQLLAKHVEVRTLEALAVEIGDEGVGDAPHAARFTRWLDDRIIRLRADCTPSWLDARIAREKLFDEEDDGSS